MNRIDILEQELSKYNDIRLNAKEVIITNDINNLKKTLDKINRIIPLVVPPEMIVDIPIKIELYDKRGLSYNDIFRTFPNVETNRISYQIMPFSIPYLKDALNMYEEEYNDLSEKEKLILVKMALIKFKKKLHSKIAFLTEEI